MKLNSNKKRIDLSIASEELGISGEVGNKSMMQLKGNVQTPFVAINNHYLDMMKIESLMETLLSIIKASV